MTIRKVIVLGLGSIGSRHAHNLRALRPDAIQIHADPALGSCAASARPDLLSEEWRDWHVALTTHSDADCAIIASPTPAHLEQMAECIWTHRIRGIYVEKPVCLVDEIEQCAAAVHYATGKPYAAGFQYRFAITESMRRSVRRTGFAFFYARDDLVARYGRDCLGAMAAHPIDTALWLLGQTRDVQIETDGVSVRGFVEHKNGRSVYDIRMDDGPRISYLNVHPLSADNRGYVDALSAWLRWVETGERDARTATLADGLAVMDVISKVRKIKEAQC